MPNQASILKLTDLQNSPTRCVDITRGTCDEAGLMVLNGGLGAAGRMALGMFWKAAFEINSQ